MLVLPTLVLPTLVLVQAPRNRPPVIPVSRPSFCRVPTGMRSPHKSQRAHTPGEPGKLTVLKPDYGAHGREKRE